MPKSGLTKYQIRSWDLINELAQESGAWVISEPGRNPLRFECVTYDLPWQLVSMGFDVASLGKNERLIPMAGGVAPGTVLAFQVDLPVGREEHTGVVP